MKFNKIVKEMKAMMGLCKINGQMLLEVFDNYTNHKRINKKFNTVSDKDFRNELDTENWNGMRAFAFFYHKELDKDTITEICNTLNDNEKCMFAALVIKHIISDEIEKVYLTGTKTFKKNVEQFHNVYNFLKDFEEVIGVANKKYFENL